MKLSSFVRWSVLSAVLVLLPCPRAEASSYCPGCVAGIIGAGAGVAVGVTAGIYFVHRSHTSLKGCAVESGGAFHLTTKNGQTYELLNAPHDLQGNRRVYLRGHKGNTASGHIFSVTQLSHDYGACTA